MKNPEHDSPTGILALAYCIALDIHTSLTLPGFIPGIDPKCSIRGVVCSVYL